MVEYRERPPTGSGMGLPLTWLLDSTNLDTYRSASTTASGTNFKPLYATADSTDITEGTDTFPKTLINTEPPRLNLATGDLLFGQQITGTGENFDEDSGKQTSGIVGSVLTYSGNGRYSRLADSNTVSRPGNYTWQASAALKLTLGDIPVGRTKVAITTSASTTDGRVVSSCVYSAADLASGGYGRQFGDKHDTQYLVNVGCSDIASPDNTNIGYTWPSASGRTTGGAGLAWTINLLPQYNFKDPESPSNDRTFAQTTGAGLTAETILHLAHREVETAAGSVVTHPLGSPAHGTVVVADSCGVVGYEGVLVATAHYTPSKQQDLTVPVSTQTDGFCAINIAVHTGETSRRTATVANTYADTTPVRGVVDRLKTDCGMLKGATRQTDWTNGSTHYTRLTSAATAADYSVFGTTTPATASSPSGESNCVRLVGDACDISAAWNGTTDLNLTFNAESVPTRVRVIPSLIGYDTNRRPTVDYHIAVSFAARPSPIQRDGSNDYTTRNNPTFDANYTDMNMDGVPCTIWHAIVRVEPTLQDSTLSDHKIVSAWNIKQATPFRPIANQKWARVPELCSAVEAGGPHQRGGLSHIWDADVFKGDLYIGADLFNCSQISGSTGNDKNGHATFGFWGHGQVWPGTAAPQVPPGHELVIFKYSAMTDPYYPGMNPSSKWPLTKWLSSKSSSLTDATAVLNASVHHANHTTTLTSWAGWEIHDWVFPQIELMAYLGTEDKTQPIGQTRQHPTIHCGSLRFTDEGKMVMGAVHQDIITSSAQKPSMDIGWPFNPDVMFDQLPPGYYLGTDGEVHPIGTNLLNPETEDFVPEVGTSVAGFTEPEVTQADSTTYSGFDTVFGYIPSWNKLVAGKARSLILLWSENGLTDGRPTKGLNKFCVNHERVGGVWQATQNWTHEDNWWSGSRIAYWYQESGQRAIPIVYGAFPAARLAAVNLPRAHPFINYSGVIKEGLPTLMPALSISPGIGTLASDYSSASGPFFDGYSGEDKWPNIWTHAQKFKFFPTLVGFSDFGPGVNPWQEWGWAGWAQPTALYDPMSYTDSTFFSDSTQAAPWKLFGDQTLFPSSAQNTFTGPVGAISHFGPLHYGMSQQMHPFATDRVWKQVHAGVGYDLPIHLLKPGAVSVRAKSGTRGSLDLELETPFHRTDTLHMQGQVDYLVNEGDSFAKGHQATPGATRTGLGQYFLSTNLWEGVTGIEGVPASGTLIGNELARWWQDHPTEHFHASALPIGYANDLDLNYIEAQRYSIPMTASVKEQNELDSLAQSEQLQASTEVFVPQTVAPVWDSGGIVSARAVTNFTSVWENKLNPCPNSLEQNQFNPNYAPDSHGFGQRIVQTNDGTLHRFIIEKSATGSGDDVIKHYMKPLHSDLFWNASALTNHSGAYIDEITITGGNYEALAAASDSNGNIHLVIQTRSGTDGRLHHVTTSPTVKRINPEPISVWDWTASTQTLISAANCINPTIAIDSNDILHLAFAQAVSAGGSNYHSQLVYYFTELASPSWTYSGLGGRFQKVAVNDGGANTIADPRRCKIAEEPRIHLLGDDTPLIVWGGTDVESAADRARKAVYANIATRQPSSVGWSFDPAASCMVVGLPPYQDFSPGQNVGVSGWDSVLDNNDKLNILAIMEEVDVADLRRVVQLAVLETNVSVYSQYNQTTGCGRHVMVYHHTDAAGRQFDTNFFNPTMTIDHENNIHTVMEVYTVQGGSDTNVTGATFRAGGAAASAYPLNFPGAVAPDANAYEKGSETNWSSWETTGAFAKNIPHLIEMWWPAVEVSTSTTTVLRSLNTRWLSVPSSSWDSTQGFQPVSTASTIAGSEMFPHRLPILRQQRFHSYSTSLDLIWNTDYTAIYRTSHPASKLYHWEGGL